MWGQSWIADYPDGDNFMQLLYGPNTGPEQQRVLRVEGVRPAVRELAPASGFSGAQPALPRDARQMEVDGAWSLHVSRLRNELIWPWIQGYKKHPILQADFQYLDVEPGRH